jgi:DNA repair photolyase
VCVEHKNPVGVITKNALVVRDVDLLARLAREARCRVTISAAFRDDETARAIEPGASPIRKRFEAMKTLADAGIEVGLSLAPVIPGLTDEAIPELLERAKEAGASFSFITMLRLPREVLPIFEERVREALPMRAEKILHAVREMRGGDMNDSRFGDRMRGVGQRWKTIEQLFRVHVRRLGMNQGEALEERETTFARPKRQLTLFE